MHRCLRCSTQCDDNVRYCPNCGSNLAIDDMKSTVQRQYRTKIKRLEIALLLSIFLPGISYFYLELWYRGVLFYLSYVIFFLVLGLKSGLYQSYAHNVNSTHIAMLIIAIYFLIYVFQVIDVIKRTNMINEGKIIF
ncbi:MAG: zinc ribbon domain-containing protein [Methanosphaera sp.]|nr:zinc ribbon domain-containing protein [Methanosphaera sp.]